MFPQHFLAWSTLTLAVAEFVGIFFPRRRSIIWFLSPTVWIKYAASNFAHQSEDPKMVLAAVSAATAYGCLDCFGVVKTVRIFLFLRRMEKERREAIAGSQEKETLPNL